MSVQSFHAAVARKRAGGPPPGDIFYVDATLGLDINPGTELLPWQTLAKVEASVTAGCTVKFKKGETWTVKGTAVSTIFLQISEDNVTLDAYGSGALPVFDLGGTVRSGIHQFSGKSGLLVKFMRVTNGGGGTGALFSAGDISGTAEDCEFDGHAVDACCTASIGGTITVRRCDISNFADDGVTCHGLNGVGSSCYIYNCTIHDGADGLNHSVTNGGDITTVCEDTTFYNNTRDIGGLDVGTHTFNRCRFGAAGQTQSPTIGGASVDPGAVGTQTVVFNSCLLDMTQSTVTAEPGFGTGTGSATLTLNQCTIVADATGPEGAGAGNITVFVPVMTMNNCAVRYVWRCAYVDTPGNLVAINCLVSGITTGSGNLTYTARIGDNTTDPGFVSGSDFHVASTGSAIYHAGADLAVALDLDGVPFHSTTPSVGCYEYVP